MTITTCKATMAMHHTDALYVEGRHTVHMCTTDVFTPSLTTPIGHTHRCTTCGHEWTSLPIDARCYACGHTAKDELENTTAHDEDSATIVMCVDDIACIDRVRANNARTITAGRGDGSTREGDDPETPRPVANSLFDGKDPEADEFVVAQSDDVSSMFAHRFVGHDGAPCLAPLPDGRYCDRPEGDPSHTPLDDADQCGFMTRNRAGGDLACTAPIGHFPDTPHRWADDRAYRVADTLAYPVAADVPDGKALSTPDLIDRLRQEPSQSLTDGEGNRFAMGAPGRMSPAPDAEPAGLAAVRDDLTRQARRSTADALKSGRTSWPYGPDHVHIDSGAVPMAGPVPPSVRRRFMSDTRFTPGVQVSEVESHTSRGNDLQGLWQRTVDIIRTQVDSLGQLADLLAGDAPIPGWAAQRAAIAADIRTSVLELLTARINVERLRPATEADVTGALTRLTAAVDVLDARVARWGTPDDPRPAETKPVSYLVDGLEPHRFRNDGSLVDQNECTWTYPVGTATVRCRYGANAMVHRRTAYLGKNAPGAAVGEPSIQDAAETADHIRVFRGGQWYRAPLGSPVPPHATMPGPAWLPEMS